MRIFSTLYYEIVTHHIVPRNDADTHQIILPRNEEDTHQYYTKDTHHIVPRNDKATHHIVPRNNLIIIA